MSHVTFTDPSLPASHSVDNSELDLDIFPMKLLNYLWSRLFHIMEPQPHK